jgi:predicted nucleic acid-binding protein
VSVSNAVDSSGWLEYFADTRRAKLFAAAIEDADRLIVPVVTIYEVFKKMLRERGENDALQAISAMRSGQVVDLDLSLALDAGHFPLPLADSLIYATAQRHGAILWTQDEAFEGLPGVRYFPKK